MKTNNDICSKLVELIKERDKIYADIKFCKEHNYGSSAELHLKNLLELLNFYNGKISSLDWVLE